MADSDICVLCKGDQETIDHLFFSCPFSTYLWALCRLKLGLPQSPIGSLHEEATLLQLLFKQKSKTSFLARATLAATVWHIWKERTARTFQFKEQHKILVFRSLFEDVRLMLKNCHWKSDTIQNQADALTNWEG